MIHRIPSGTRDVLPDELRELRAITEGIRGVFETRGYGEVATPALEYEEVLRRGEEHAAGARYRTFDEQGSVLALRSWGTIRAPPRSRSSRVSSAGSARRAGGWTPRGAPAAAPPACAPRFGGSVPRRCSRPPTVSRYWW